MTWTDRYTPPEMNLWQGRLDSPDSSCFFQIIKPLNLTAQPQQQTEPLSFAILGFCCDEGIKRNQGRIGAAAGPDALRSVLAKFPIQKPNLAIYDAGNITCTDGNLEAAQQALREAVSHLLAHQITPILIGGGHEIAWGHYQGIASAISDTNLGIINFDAHFDMRPLLSTQLGSSGTPFLQIANAHLNANRRFDYNCIGIQHAGNTRQLFETAKQYNAQVILADDLHMGYMDKCINFIDRIIDHNQKIYVSICLDVFATPYAPGVSAPQAMGLTPWQVIPLLRQLAMSGKVISYDLAELSPIHDNDQRTVKLAANLVYEIIHHHVKSLGTY